MYSEQYESDPREITLYSSKWKQFGLFLASTLFTAAGILLAAEGHWIGFVAVVFFGLGIPIFLIQLLPGSSYLRLDRNGFEYVTAFRKHSTRWDDIESFGIMSLKRGAYKMVGWNYKPEYAGGGSLRRLNRQLAGLEAGLPDTYGLKPDKLLLLLSEYHELYGRETELEDEE